MICKFIKEHLCGQLQIQSEYFEPYLIDLYNSCNVDNSHVFVQGSSAGKL